MSVRSLLRRTTLVLCGVLAVQASAAQVPPYPELSLSTGLHFSRGDYGTDAEIEDTYVPLGFTAGYERVAFSVRVPYLCVDTTSAGVSHILANSCASPAVRWRAKSSRNRCTWDWSSRPLEPA